jgi:hypothetical protein
MGGRLGQHNLVGAVARHPEFEQQPHDPGEVPHAVGTCVRESRPSAERAMSSFERSASMSSSRSSHAACPVSDGATTSETSIGAPAVDRGTEMSFSPMRTSSGATCKAVIRSSCCAGVK